MISLIKGRRMRQAVRAAAQRLFGGEPAIEDLWKNFFCVASNYSQAREHVARSGPLLKALYASMAIPGLFPPVALMGRLLVDGDVVEKVPVRAAKALFPKVVAVDVSNPPPKEPPRTALEAALLAGEASRRRLKALALKEADVVIALDPPFPIDTFDHERLEFVYELGKHRAKERLPEVLALARTRLRDLLPRR